MSSQISEPNKQFVYNVFFLIYKRGIIVQYLCFVGHRYDTNIRKKILPVIPISFYFSIIMARSQRATDGRSRLNRQSKSRIIRIFDQKPVTIFSQRYTNPRPIILCLGRIIFSIWLRNNGRLSGRTSGRP